MRELQTNIKSNRSYNSAEKCNIIKNTDTENLTPNQFLERYSLPRIVKITPEKPVTSVHNNYHTTISLLSGRLLIYRHYRSGKIEAKNFNDNCNNRHKEILQRSSYPETKNLSTVIIPDTYEGWFSVVTERGQIKARLYTSIQHLIMAEVTAFLIAASTLTGYTHTPRKNIDGICEQYSKISIKSGQILKLLAVYQDISCQSSRSKRLSWPLFATKHEITKYAQCLTASNEIVYIPVTTNGDFYAVSTANNTAQDNVSKIYQIGNLLQVFPLPVRVCLIAPNKSRGSMLLDSYHKEHVMLACVLDHNTNNEQKFRFLEIDVNSKLYVSCIHDEHILFKSAYVQEALRNCNINSDNWCRKLKIIHHIYPQNFVKTQALKKDEKMLENSRKISLGDRKTVKSASFRYSTSYDTGDIKSPYKKILYNTIYDSNNSSLLHVNSTGKTNKNCSLGPMQTPEHILESKILAKVNKEKLLKSSPFYNNNNTKGKESVKEYEEYSAIKRLEKLTYCEHINQNKSDNSINKNAIIYPVTKMNTYCNIENKNEVTRISSLGINKKIVQIRENDTDDHHCKISEFSNKIMSDNHAKGLYKTRVKIQINGPYSNVVDSLNTEHIQNQENIYAEIEPDNFSLHYYHSQFNNTNEKQYNNSHSFLCHPSTKINVS